MNQEQLTTRLDVLLQQQVINQQAYDATEDAFKQLVKILEKNEIDQAEMLFTHLPTALTRITRGEDVEAPSEEMLAELKDSPYYSLAKEQVEYIENIWEKELPKAEFDYLLLHYTTVITLNKGGN